MKSRLDCLGLGIAPADILMQIEKYPPPGVKIDATALTLQGGGPIPTAMVAVARLGLKSGLLATVGDDLFGRLVFEELRREGVDTRLIIVKKGYRTAIASGWVENGSGRRTIVLERQITIKPSDIRLSSLPDCRAVHLDGRDLPACLKLARWARLHHIPTIFDIGSLRNDVSEIFPLIDHLVCSADFALPYTGARKPRDAVIRLRKKCPGTIIVTSGIRGSLGAEPDGNFHFQKAFKVDTIDTTGAGDVYHGAYIVGLLKGWNLEKRMEFASAAAAIKCTRPGGRSGIPGFRQVQSFLKRKPAAYA